MNEMVAALCEPDGTRARDYLRARGPTDGYRPTGYRRRVRILEEFTASVARERSRDLSTKPSKYQFMLTQHRPGVYGMAPNAAHIA